MKILFVNHFCFLSYISLKCDNTLRYKLDTVVVQNYQRRYFNGHRKYYKNAVSGMAAVKEAATVINRLLVMRGLSIY